LGDRLYRSYASPVDFELKILSGILRAFRPVKFRRGKEFLLMKPEEEKVQVTLRNLESGNAEIGAVILRHLVHIIQRFVI
jgi:hypothetical protein